MPNYWLMKSEPSVYSIDNLERDGKTCWEGVRNYRARNYMREMEIGDRVLFYHSNAKPSAAVGIARVVKGAYPDHYAPTRSPARLSSSPCFRTILAACSAAASVTVKLKSNDFSLLWFKESGFLKVLLIQQSLFYGHVSCLLQQR